jgi:glycosyltransferase involved in cell wall biosynthesis
MKIVMDYRKYDGVVGGVERGVIEITRHLLREGHQVVLLPKRSRLREVEAQFEALPNLKLVPLDVRSHVMSFRNVWVDSVTIPSIAARERADIIHFPYNWSFPLRKSAPCLLTIHDVIPLNFREAQGFFTNLFLYRPGMRMATRLNDAIATVSEFSRQDLSENLGVPLTKVTAIPNGLNDPHPPDEDLQAALRERFKLGDGLVLYVGGIHERKNVARLIRAFAKFRREEHFPGKLLITGSVSGAPYQEKMKAQLDQVVASTDVSDYVIFTGFVSDRELEALMRLALFLVYPSLYEGFGIPILESMQIGTPVITSNLTAMPEVAGEAALLVNPYRVDDIAAAMARLLNDPSKREELVERGKQWAREFSWDRTAEEYLELYRALIG